MPVERYFLNEPLAAGDQKSLKEGEFHHLAHVIRTRVGEEVELVNGQGSLAVAVVESINKSQAALTIVSAHQEAPPKVRLILAQALPKPNRLDFILEKGTELGVTDFWLFPGHYSPKKEMFPNQIERAQTLTIAALKQCGRLYTPHVEIKPPLSKWTSLEGAAFFGDVNPAAPPFARHWQNWSGQETYIWLIGPESGFSSEEEDKMRALGAKGVKLHANILRTDTAALTAMALLSHYLL